MSTTRTIRSLRKEFALTQNELADLLATSQTIVSRIEGSDETASCETAFALQVLFGVEPRLLFHRHYRKVEDAVIRRAATLDRRIAGRTDPASVKTQRLLRDVVKRARPNEL